MSRRSPVTLRERLKTPVALVGQGFLVGGIIFFATHDVPLKAATQAAPVDAGSASAR